MTIGPKIYPQLFPAGGSKELVQPSGWDRIAIGGLVLPGKSRVVKGGSELRVDLKNAKGRNGARPTFHGLQPKEIEIQVTVWTDEQLDALDAILRRIAPNGTSDPKPYTLDAPALRHLPIDKAVVIGVSSLVESGEIRGGLSVSLSLLQWMPTPVKAGGKKSASVTPTRSVRNVRTEADAKGQNPAPSAQPKIFGPGK